MSKTAQRIDGADLKRRLSGCEAQALQHIGIGAEFLTGKNVPCPKCGGTDRFRFDRAKGYCFCNKCHNKNNGDIIADIQWFTGKPFLESLALLAAYAGMISDASPKPKPTSKPRKLYANMTQAALAANHERLTVEALHEYRLADGELVYVKLRLRKSDGSKDFKPLTKKSDGRWYVGGPEVPTWLYGLDTLAGAEVVFVVEGEKTADALRTLGFTAITWADGASSYGKADWSPLANSPIVKQIILMPDNDKPGRDAMHAVAAIIRKLNPSVQIKIVDVPGIIELGDKADAADLVTSYPGDTETPRSEIRAAVDAAESWAPAKGELAAVSSIDEPNLGEITGQTDEANSRRLWKLNQGRFVWCAPWKSFVIYDGRRWTRDDTMKMGTMAIDTYHSLYDELKSIDPKVGSDAFRGITSFIKNSGSARGQAAMLELVKSQPGIALMPSDFNQNPDLFNCENGTIDLKTGKLHAHDPADKITQLAPVVFDPKANCPKWRSFIDLIFGGDADLIRYIQAAAGYSLTGSIEEHALFFCFGKGSNGKSTFLETLRDIVGDYGIAAAKDLLLTNGNEQHPTGLTDLFSKRWANCIEADEGKRLCESTVKMLTGGDSIRARGMRENFWEFKPTHKIWLSVNHKPTVRGDDDGIWRRIQLIPFKHKFTDDQKDKKFTAKLRPEKSGILNWMLEGLADWRVNGLQVPPAVAQASNEYRAQQDRLADWIADRCLVSASMKEKAHALYVDYANWSGLSARGSRTFYEKLSDRFEKKHSNGTWYLGIALRG